MSFNYRIGDGGVHMSNISPATRFLNEYIEACGAGASIWDFAEQYQKEFLELMEEIENKDRGSSHV